MEKEITKEILKKIVDNGDHNIKIKNDIKLIVDVSNAPAEIIERILAYFAGLNI